MIMSMCKTIYTSIILGRLHYIIYLCCIIAIDSYADIFNPSYIENIPADRLMYFDMQYSEFEIKNENDLSHDVVWTLPNNIVSCYIDEENCHGYFNNLFGESEYLHPFNETLFDEASSYWAKLDFVKENDVYHFYCDRIDFSGSTGNYSYYIKNKEALEESSTIKQADNQQRKANIVANNKIEFELKDGILRLILLKDQLLIRRVYDDIGNPSLIHDIKGDNYDCISSLSGKQLISTFVDINENENVELWTMKFSPVGHKYDNFSEQKDIKTQIVNIVFDNNDVYIGNLDNNTPNCWLRGYLKDNKLILPKNQLYFYAMDWKRHKTPCYREMSTTLFFVPANIWLAQRVPEHVNNSYPISSFDACAYSQLEGELFFNTVPTDNDLTFDYDIDLGSIYNASSDFLFDYNIHEAMQIDILEHTYIKPELGTYCDVSFVRKNSKVKMQFGSNYDNKTKIEYYNLLGIPQGNNKEQLPFGIFVEVGPAGNKLIKKYI